MFATAWPGFHKFARGPSIMTFFTASPPVVELANFRLAYIELTWVSLIHYNHNIKFKFYFIFNTK